MYNPLAMKSWSPYIVGAAIGVLSWFAFATADHPLGITTAFEHTAALTAKAAIPGFEQKNEYYAAKAREGNAPKIGWEWMLVAGVFFGALASTAFSGDWNRVRVPPLWRASFSGRRAVRYTAAVVGGAVMMFGARLAQGCTSGHGISGGLQLAVSSWIFAAVFFPVAIVTAFFLFNREASSHV